MPVFALLGIIFSSFFVAPDFSNKYVMDDKHILSIGGGYTVKTGAYDKDRFVFFANYISNLSLPRHEFQNVFGNFLYHNISHINPMIGVGSINTGSWYVHFGLSRDWYITERLAFNFFFGPALVYLSPADQNIMTGILQFKSSIELNYAITDNIRVGLSYFHMSNGGITTSGPNSGIDTINLNLAFAI